MRNILLGFILLGLIFSAQGYVVANGTIPEELVPPEEMYAPVENTKELVVAPPAAYTPTATTECFITIGEFEAYNLTELSLPGTMRQVRVTDEIPVYTIDQFAETLEKITQSQHTEIIGNGVGVPERIMQVLARNPINYRGVLVVANLETAHPDYVGIPSSFCLGIFAGEDAVVSSTTNTYTVSSIWLAKISPPEQYADPTTGFVNPWLVEPWVHCYMGLDPTGQYLIPSLLPDSGFPDIRTGIATISNVG